MKFALQKTSKDQIRNFYKENKDKPGKNYAKLVVRRLCSKKSIANEEVFHIIELAVRSATKDEKWIEFLSMITEEIYVASSEKHRRKNKRKKIKNFT